MSDEERKKKRLQLCIFTNCIVFVVLSFSILFLTDKTTNSYLHIGPNDSLNILGFPINSWKNYILFQILIAFITITDVLINEIASPILGFNIYNPDKKEILDFTRNELQAYANLHWFINASRDALMILVSVSQIDFALLRVFYGQITSFYTIRLLLNEKTFPRDDVYSQIELVNEEFHV